MLANDISNDPVYKEPHLEVLGIRILTQKFWGNMVNPLRKLEEVLINYTA